MDAQREGPASCFFSARLPGPPLTLLRDQTLRETMSFGERKYSQNVLRKTKELSLSSWSVVLNSIESQNYQRNFLKTIFMLSPTLAILVQRVWEVRGWKL